MRYAVKQKIFSFGDKFTIRDENGSNCYQVKGKVLSLGDKLRIYDMYGKELIYIEQKIFRFMPEYNIYYLGQLYAVVKKELTLLRPKFNIKGFHADYRIEGNVWAMEFSVLRDGQPVAHVSKRWFSLADTYGVDVSDEADPVFILALVIVIDQVLHDNNHNNS